MIEADVEGARAAYQQLIDRGDETDKARIAALHQANLLEREGDYQGAWTALEFIVDYPRADGISAPGLRRAARSRLTKLVAKYPGVALANVSNHRRPATIDVAQLEAEVPYVTTERKAAGTYEVRRADTRSMALTYLRARQVRDEKYYVIVETPAGNIGRDLIVIFEEPSGTEIDIAWREPLPIPQASRTACARCAYPVVPVGPQREAEAVARRFSGNVEIHVVASLDELASASGGYRCLECGNLACAACYLTYLTDPVEQARESTTKQHLSCWLCASDVEVLVEK